MTPSERAREWKLAAVIALLVAAVAGVRAGLATPRWDTGDLLVGLYFAALSLPLWLRAMRLTGRRAHELFTRPHRTAVLLGLAVGGPLPILDLATGGAV